MTGDIADFGAEVLHCRGWGVAQRIDLSPDTRCNTSDSTSDDRLEFP